MNKNNLSIIGYYTSNFGDLLMLKGLLMTIPKVYKHLYILTYGELSRSSFLYLGVIDDRFTIINLNKKRKHVALLLKSVITSKHIIWGGGTCFNQSENAFGGIRIMKLYKLFGASVNYIGVGINTYNSTRLLDKSVKLALSISNCFVVRDEGSYSYIKERVNKAFEALEPDLVFLNTFPSFNETEKDKTVFVSYRCVDAYFGEAIKFRDSFVKSLVYETRKNRFNRVVIFPSDSIVDYYDNKYIATNLSSVFDNNVKVFFVDSLKIDEAISQIGSSSLVITGRLHIGVVATILKVPFILLDYSSKNRSFISDSGIYEKVLFNYELLKDETKLSSCITEVLNKFHIAKSFPPTVNNLKHRIESLFE